MIFYGKVRFTLDREKTFAFYVDSEDQAWAVSSLDGLLERFDRASVSADGSIDFVEEASSSSGEERVREALRKMLESRVFELSARPLPDIRGDGNGSGSDFTPLGKHAIDLSGADFSGVRLERADFRGATLAGTSFAGANLTGAVFGGDKPATFGGNVDFTGANLDGADFTNASLLSGEVKSVRPRFGTSAGTRTKLAGANVHTGFLGRNWSYLDCTGATIVFDPGFDGEDLVASFAILPSVDFAGRRLAGAKFIDAQLAGAHFGNCDLEDAQFNGALLEGADFSGARLGLADFSQADLSGVVFVGTNLKGAKFRGSLLLLTDFSNAFLAEVDFAAIGGRRMQGVSFNNACLVSADFRNVEMREGPGRRVPSFSGALLLGTDFRGAGLTEAILTNAKLADTEGTITIILAPRRGPTQMLRYEPTRLPPDKTGAKTRCPDGAPGPCTRERLRTPNIPTVWEQPGGSAAVQ